MEKFIFFNLCDDADDDDDSGSVVTVAMNCDDFVSRRRCFKATW